MNSAKDLLKRELKLKLPKGKSAFLWGARKTGRAFEHFIFQELSAHRSYSELNYSISYYRTKTGMEVDFILGNGEIAIEIKGGTEIRSQDLKSLESFQEEFSPKKSILVSNEKLSRKSGKIEIIPYRIFLELLWNGKIIN